MDIILLISSLLMVLVAMYVIKYACDSFEDASEYLGKKVYRMKPGIRGATIDNTNAMGANFINASKAGTLKGLSSLDQLMAIINS